MPFYPQKREEFLALLWRGNQEEKDSLDSLDIILGYFFEIFSYFHKEGNKRNAAYALALLGRFLASHKKGENLFSQCFTISLSWAKQIMNRPLEAFIFLSEGMGWEKLNQPEKAYEFYEKGYHLLEKIREESDFFFALKKSFLERLMDFSQKKDSPEAFAKFRADLERLVSQWIPLSIEEFLPSSFQFEMDGNWEIEKIGSILKNITSDFVKEDEKTEIIDPTTLEESRLEEALEHVQHHRITMAMKALKPRDIQRALEEERAKEIASSEKGEKKDSQETQDPTSDEKDAPPQNKDQNKLEDETIDGLLRQAEEKLQQGYYKKVASLCEEVLKIQPHHERAIKLLKLAGELKLILERLLRKAFSYEEENRLQEALQVWYKILDMTPDHPKVLASIEKVKTQIQEQITSQWEETKSFYEKGSIRLALAKGQEILKLAPDHSLCRELVEKIKESLKKGEQLLLLSQKALQEGDLNKAQKYAKEALELDPHKEEAKKILQEIQGGGISEEERKKRDIGKALMKEAWKLVDLDLKKEAFQISLIVLSLDPGRSDAMELAKQLKSEIPSLEKVEQGNPLIHPLFTDSQKEGEKTRETGEIEKGGEEEAFTRILEKRKATRIFRKEKKSSPLLSTSSLSSFMPPPSQENQSKSPKDRKKLISFLEEVQEDQNG